MLYRRGLGIGAYLTVFVRPRTMLQLYTVYNVPYNFSIAHYYNDLFYYRKVVSYFRLWKNTINIGEFHLPVVGTIEYKIT